MYVVIENTPGYLPDDDDPPTFEEYADACAYLLEEVARLEEFIAEGEGEPATVSGEGWAFVTDTTREHDLGRNFSVEVCEES